MSILDLSIYCLKVVQNRGSPRKTTQVTFGQTEKIAFKVFGDQNSNFRQFLYIVLLWYLENI